jgi:hypothetical protein
MIVLVVCGFVALVAIAVVVGVLDAVRAPELRLRAADRRDRWEAGRAPLQRPDDIGGDGVT